VIIDEQMTAFVSKGSRLVVERGYPPMAFGELCISVQCHIDAMKIWLATRS
jgi:hypothetical protein